MHDNNGPDRHFGIVKDTFVSNNAMRVDRQAIAARMLSSGESIDWKQIAS